MILYVILGIILICSIILIINKKYSVEGLTDVVNYTDELDLLYRYIFLIRAYTLNYSYNSQNLTHIKQSIDKNVDLIAKTFNNIYQGTYSVINVAFKDLTNNLISIIENTSSVSKQVHPLESAQLLAGTIYNANNKYKYERLKELTINMVELILTDINTIKYGKQDTIEFSNIETSMHELMNYIQEHAP